MKINKFRVYDVLHKSVVTSLIAFSAAGTIWLGYKAINWFTVGRPIMNEQQRRINEERIAAEQLAHETELMAEKQVLRS